MLSGHSKMISQLFLCDLAYGGHSRYTGKTADGGYRQPRAHGTREVGYSTIELVPPTRIERATRGLGNRCSIQLSYGGGA